MSARSTNRLRAATRIAPGAELARRRWDETSVMRLGGHDHDERDERQGDQARPVPQRKQDRVVVNEAAFRRLPVCGLTDVQIALRPWL